MEVSPAEHGKRPEAGDPGPVRLGHGDVREALITEPKATYGQIVSR